MRMAILWAVLPLIGILILGAFALLIAERWRKREPEITRDTEEQLTEFRQLLDRGELTQEEYDRIRHRLGERLLRKHPENRPAAAPPGAGSPPPADPAPPPA